MNDEIDNAILRMINQEYIARTGRPHLDLMELKSALDAAGLIPAQRLCNVEHDLELHMAIAQSETERAEQLEAVLAEARKVIASLPDDALGIGGGHGVIEGEVCDFTHSIKDEVLDFMDKALAQQPQPEPTDDERAETIEIEGKTKCKECGMLLEPDEYHPYAACLAYHACHDSGMVRTAIDEVRAYGAMYYSDWDV